MKVVIARQEGCNLRPMAEIPQIMDEVNIVKNEKLTEN